jgi:quinol monooxygenase YgiN
MAEKTSLGEKSPQMSYERSAQTTADLRRRHPVHHYTESDLQARSGFPLPAATSSHRYNQPFMAPYYGMHGHFTAQPGQGDALAEILLAAAEGLRANEACLLYLVSRSPDDPDLVWVTEAWTSKSAHDESLQGEDVKAAIQRARPLIAGITGTELLLLGGKGI